MANNKYVVLFSTTGTMEEASKIAEHLVANHLVACVNIVPSVQSIYWWNNSINKDSEVLMIMKTHSSYVSKVEQAIRLLHSYQVPELIVLPLQYGLPEYLKWIDDSLQHEA